MFLFVSPSTSYKFNSGGANEKWPVSVYGGDGAGYATAPVIKGFLIVNSKNLNGLIYKTNFTSSSLDTLLNSDTLYGRIKLYVLGKNIDIQLSRSSVVSIPSSYIDWIIGAYI